MAPWRLLAGIPVFVPESRNAQSTRPVRQLGCLRHFHHAENHADVHRIHVKRMRLRIERSATPVGPSVCSGKEYSGLEADRREQGSEDSAFNQLFAVCPRFGSDIGQVFGAKTLTGEG